MTERRLLDKHGAAEILKLGVSTIEKLTSAKRIPHVKLGRSVRYDSADLWAWIETKKTGIEVARQVETKVNFEPQKAR